MEPITFDPTKVLLSALLIMPIIFGLVEFIKDVGNLSGVVVKWVSFVVGFCLEGLVLVGGMLPPPYQFIVYALLACLTVGLAVSGYYKYFSERITKVSDIIAITNPSGGKSE